MWEPRGHRQHMVNAWGPYRVGVGGYGVRKRQGPSRKTILHQDIES